MSDLHPSTVEWLDRSITEVTEYSDHNPTDTEAARAVMHLRRLRAFVDEHAAKALHGGAAQLVRATGFRDAFFC